ncbi:MAG: nucleoside deaminase [Gammaproteobacteria bacterium]
MDKFMLEAIRESEAGLAEGGIPIGSVLVHQGIILGRGHNRRIQKASSILHGEMDALENAGRLPASVYKNSTLYTTLSPCAMCTGAILLYGIAKVVIADNVNFKGEEALLESRGVELKILNDTRCIDMMKNFIESNPELWHEDIGSG